MADPMNIPMARKWLEKISAMGPYGWAATHKKIGAYIRKITRKRFRAHQEPEGARWAALYSKPAPLVGERVPILVPGGVVTRRIKTVRGRRRARAFRERYGPPYKPLPAIYRPRRKPGAPAALMPHQWLVKDRGVLRTGKAHVEYGYTQGTRGKTLRRIHFGSTYRGARVPPRDLLGLNRADLRHIDNMYADAYLRRTMKGK